MNYKWPMAGILLALFIGLGAVGSRAQSSDTDKVPYLVAQRDLADPFFRESVVLMLTAPDADEVVGLIVNKRTRIPLHEVFPKDSALKNRMDPVYFGGPVDTDAPSALFRSSKAPQHAVHLTSDLYVSFDPDTIEKILKYPELVSDIHVFLGRSQWAPEQLDDEVQGGAWYTQDAEISLIFSQQPENVWRNLLGRAEPGTVAQLRTSEQRARYTSLNTAASFPN